MTSQEARKTQRLLARGLAACGILCLLAAAATAQEGGTGGNLGGKETVLRVLQLSQELEKLPASLPPETQESLRGQLIDRLAAPDRTPEEARQAPGLTPAPAQPDSAEASATEASATEAIAAQPSPAPDLSVRAVEPEAEPTIAETTANEPSAAELPSLEPQIAEPSSNEHPSLEPQPTPEPTRIASNAGTDRRVTPPPQSSPSTVPQPPVPSTRRGCQTVVPFDSDGDDKLTGLDRYWRHFYLWTDVDEDGSVDEKELESPYERGIREIDVGLRSFVRGKGKRKRSLEIQAERYILLDVGGDGWSGRPRGDDGALAVDASAIREDGGPDLRDARGRAVEGVQPFEPGWRLIVGDEEIVANCPRP